MGDSKNGYGKFVASTERERTALLEYFATRPGVTSSHKMALQMATIMWMAVHGQLEFSSNSKGPMAAIGDFLQALERAKFDVRTGLLPGKGTELLRTTPGINVGQATGAVEKTLTFVESLAELGDDAGEALAAAMNLLLRTSPVVTRRIMMVDGHSAGSLGTDAFQAFTAPEIIKGTNAALRALDPDTASGS